MLYVVEMTEVGSEKDGSENEAQDDGREIDIYNVSDEDFEYLLKRQEEIQEEIQALQFELYGVQKTIEREVKRIKKNMED